MPGHAASQDSLSSAEGGSLAARGSCSDQPSTHVQTACRKAPSQPKVCAVTRVVKLLLCAYYYYFIYVNRLLL